MLAPVEPEFKALLSAVPFMEFFICGSDFLTYYPSVIYHNTYM